MQRREFVATSAGLLAGVAGGGVAASPVLTRPIPSTGETLPAVGMGTWLTFHVAISDAAAMAQRRQVLERFMAAGGGLIDSSPMYATAEQVLGELLPTVPGRKVFSATKVWTPLSDYGPTQMQRSLDLWRLARCDLMQVHNLLNWPAHLKTLRAWKAAGRIRYLGVTTSHGRAHDELAAILRSEALDFVQVTYHPADRSAEPLLELARQRGVAVIVNRPLDGGALPQRLARRPLPAIASELGCDTAAALLLKWELSHPAVTCVIPATTRPDHMQQNLQAGRGPLPDARQREALGRWFELALG